MKNRILVGMSGGIDSTWAVKNLLENGFDVEGAILNMHQHSPVEAARRAADELGVKLHVIDCRENFDSSVKRNFVSEYANGRTPNPCVVCNSDIKFKILAKTARELGIEKISTGHYVRVEYNSETSRYEMYSASDLTKDQSYFLWRVEQSDLAMFYSVLDSRDKTSVKKEMSDTGIFHDSKESQEICFIPNDDRIEFLKSEMTDEEAKKSFTEGDFVTLDGKAVGRHQGLAIYTLGQRKGLGIALGKPAYVLGLDSSTNQVTVGFAEDNVCQGFTVSDIRFVSIPELEGEIECLVRVRHRGALRDACVRISGKKAEISLKTFEKSVSSGQSAVFYDKYGRVLFGGFID